jgi:hypothetical protein
MARMESSLCDNGDNRMDETHLNSDVLAEIQPSRETYCETYIGTINAKAEIALRNRGLTFSSVCIYLLLVSHIAFVYLGKSFPVPDIVWAIVLAPWIGAAGGKVSGLIDDIISKGKK